MARTRMTVVALAMLAMGGTAAKADPRLVEALASDPSPKVRAQAALGLLSRPATPEGNAALVQALEDPATIVRGSAARALGSLGTDGSFAPLCRAVGDPDRFVSRWARWAASRVAARSGSIAFTVRDIRVEPGRIAAAGSGGARGRILADDMTRNLQDGVLQVLIGTGRFDVDAGMDFSDEVEGAVRTAGAAGPAPVRLALRGRLLKVTGDERRAEVEVRIEAVGPFGLVLWEAAVRGVGSATDADGGEQGASEDDYEDEYTIKEAPVDARVRAAEVAGRAAAGELVRALSPGPGEGR